MGLWSDFVRKLENVKNDIYYTAVGVKEVLKGNEEFQQAAWNATTQACKDYQRAAKRAADNAYYLGVGTRSLKY